MSSHRKLFGRISLGNWWLYASYGLALLSFSNAFLTLATDDSNKYIPVLIDATYLGIFSIVCSVAWAVLRRGSKLHLVIVPVVVCIVSLLEVARRLPHLGV